ncbi:aspartate/glutamate racemase family protein, partial [bacterium]|nr:aspartate/glutamate racemase family protein [bacterium]
VEPGVRAAAAATKNGRIGVIGTKSTIRSAAYQDRLRALDASFHITAQACPLFVPLVEEDWVEHPVALQAAEQYLASMRDENIDVLILGCTHFPLLEPIIQNVMGDSVTLVNSAEEVTREVAEYLQQHQLESQAKRWKDLFYASDDIAGFERMYYRFGGRPDARFVEAPSDFFQMVQQIHLYKDSVFTHGIQWFESTESK